MSAEIAMVQEEKKSQDSGSVDESVEVPHWSDDPEKAYFHEMFQGREGEESILGNNTINDQIYDGHGRDEEIDDGLSFMQSDPNAPLRLAVLGVEDDMSTLAGDTISGSVVTEGAVFSNANLPYAITTKPRPRDFREYEPEDLRTPPKKNRWHPYMSKDDTDDDDNRTQPETPPGVHVIHAQDRMDDVESATKDGDASTFFSYYASPSKKIYVCAAVIGCILLLAIVGLAVGYSQLAGDGGDSSSSQSAQAGVSTGGFNLDNFPPTFTAPIAPRPSASPAFPPSLDVNSTEDSGMPSRAPVIAPTRAPVPVNFDSQIILLNILASSGVNSTTFMTDQTSPQYRAVVWMAADPNFNAYTEKRMVQRWTLAVLAFGLYTDEDKVNSMADVLPNWLAYDVNECSWFSTRDSFICNGFGYYEYLSLESQNLFGTIPTELGLLSDSLLFLNLVSNRLTGTIPTEVGNLFLLQRLRVHINELKGTIPTEIGRLTDLDVLGVGRNFLTGTIPTQIGLMSSLDTVGLEDNFLTGTLPAAIGDLRNMVFLSVNKNELGGNIPAEIGNLSQLATLNVTNNNFSGEVPSEVCGLGGLTEFIADCHLVSCSCCSDCTPTPEPTLAPATAQPTVALTAFPTLTPTQMPTPAPTPIPTIAPTSCGSSFMEWVPDCIDIGDELVVRFRNCEPQFGDWIGLFSRNDDPTDLPSPVLWVWTCGTQNCRGSPQSNTVTLNADAVDADAGVWPLRRGDYHAYLIRNVGPPYTAVLQTARMRIRENDC